MKPWDVIGNPDIESTYTVRLADPDHPFDFFWGKNSQGQYVFRFFGDFDSELCSEAPKMSGIDTIGGVENKRSHLTLVLENNEDDRIFFLLCRSLMDATKILTQGNDTAAARVILTHLLRWQRLLQNRRSSKELSLSEQIGLFGELLVLKEIFLPELDAEQAVLCWTGPLGDEQDFSYAQALVEVKTTRSTRDRKIRISSVDQLDSVSGEITLIFQTISPLEKAAADAQTLNSLADVLRKTMEAAGPAALDLFETRLLMMGYNVLPAYDRHFFTLAGRIFFAVGESFPRICAKDIPDGVIDLAYSLFVDKCSKWKIEKDQALGRVFVTDG